MKEDESGWFHIKLNNETGFFPGNYLFKLKSKRNLQARVLYDCDAEYEDEISLQKDQIVEVKPFYYFKGTISSEFLSQKGLKFSS